MKKFFKILFSALLGFTALCTPFLHTASLKSVSAAETSLASTNNNNIDGMLSRIAITQDGYRFSKADFEFKDGQYHLYVNTAITLINTTKDYNLSIIYTSGINFL